MDQHPSARSCTSRGTSSCEAVPAEPSMNLYIHSTTGTRFELSLPQEETVEGLKRRLSQRLKVPKERLALLHKETRLSSGKLQDLGISDGSKLTLVPTVEAGLMSQASRPEQSVMQALESLTETQVRNDFLSGRSPLTLALRVGDHMMFVQLQLAAQQSGGPQLQHRHLISRGNTEAATGQPTVQPTVQPSRVPHIHPLSPHHHPQQPHNHPMESVFHKHSHLIFVSIVFLLQANCSTNSPGSGSSPSARSRKPGAIIESFVNHAPGVFSGTFSGTLHPNCQDSNGRPRRDIGTILQILNDLLSATRHYQGMPPSLTQLRYQTQCGSPTSPSPSPPPSPPVCQSQIRMCKPPGDRIRQTENRATRCKVERLQLLMQQKRLRRKARRDQRGPYQWLPNRKAGRSNSNSSMSSEGSLDLDFDDSVWKPDVKADLKSEYVMA
uniref:Midnolin n=1 Tax=Xiphophorus couchianus TaxID=32473 RepID=A0A3B5LJH7_9TELE